jgi:DNA-binding NarL/FixJ family response regulator
VDRGSVLVADDHTSILEAVRHILAPEFDVVGVATDGEQVVQMAGELHPNVIVLDVAMPRLSGIEAARRLASAAGGTRPAIVFISVMEDADVIAAALATGAQGYVLKTRMVADLVPAIRAALAGRRFVSSGIERR